MQATSLRHFIAPALAGAVVLFTAGATDAWCDEAQEDMFAIRGDGVVTQEQFAAAAARIPEDRRQSFLRNRSRLERFLDETLLTAQLAAAAREAGLDERPEVRARMEWGAQEALARAWLDHYKNELNDADYEAMAREQWMLNKESYRTEEAIDVTHILIKSEVRGEEEALALTERLADELAEDPSRFDDLVFEYSEDSSAARSRGRFQGVLRGQMVAPFETAAFALEEGQIAGPIETRYGFHLIRLDKRHPSRQQTFEELRVQLVDSMRTRYRKDRETAYLSQLTALEVELTDEAVREMVRRQFGEDALAPGEEILESE